MSGLVAGTVRTPSSQFLALAPASSFLSVQTPGGSGGRAGRWVPATYMGDTDLAEVVVQMFEWASGQGLSNK